MSVLNEKKRNRRLVITSLVVSVLAFGFIGMLMFRVSLSRHNIYGVNEPERPFEDPKIASAMHNLRIATAKQLRERYQQWAVQHKEELKAMLKSDSSNDVAMQKVWGLLPAEPMQGLGLTVVQMEQQSPSFSWRPSDKAIPRIDVATPRIRENLEKALRQSIERRQQDFSKFRDFEIAQSFELGRENISLWASGRITTNKLESNSGRQKDSSGNIPAAINVQTEVVPPFEFLSAKRRKP